MNCYWRANLGVACLVLALMHGCDQPSTRPASALPTTTIVLGDKPFTVEIARKDKDRQRGLMDRDSMPADHGMIFVFPDVRPRSFWMRNTRIPLDIIFLKPGGEIVSIHTMKAFDLSSTTSAGPAMYAIELNAGVAGELRLRAGDKVVIPADARETDE